MNHSKARIETWEGKNGVWHGTCDFGGSFFTVRGCDRMDVLEQIEDDIIQQMSVEKLREDTLKVQEAYVIPEGMGVLTDIVEEEGDDET